MGIPSCSTRGLFPPVPPVGYSLINNGGLFLDQQRWVIPVLINNGGYSLLLSVVYSLLLSVVIPALLRCVIPALLSGVLFLLTVVPILLPSCS